MDDTDTNDISQTTDPRSEQMRLVIARWIKHEATISAYIASVVRDRHHIEDLTQEVASVVSAKVDVYDPNQPFLPWTLGIARNLMLKYLRTQRRDRHVFDAELLTGLARLHEAQADQATARKAALDRCMQRLPDKSRALLHSRYFDKTSVQQMARQLGQSDAAVSRMLYRLRQRLATCIRSSLAKSERA